MQGRLTAVASHVGACASVAMFASIGAVTAISVVADAAVAIHVPICGNTICIATLLGKNFEFSYAPLHLAVRDPFLFPLEERGAQEEPERLLRPTPEPVEEPGSQCLERLLRVQTTVEVPYLVGSPHAMGQIEVALLRQDLA
uniref:Putative secreted protein n=1 Tax=Ixodes ricinus TaxID=34613 RepID=A0A6B0UTH2_IXORI